MNKPIDVFSIWPTVGEMAVAMGDKPDTVRKWRVAGRIPEDAWDRLISAAKAVGKSIGAQDIYEFNAPMRRRGKGAKPLRRRASQRVSARA